MLVAKENDQKVICIPKYLKGYATLKTYFDNYDYVLNEIKY